MDARFDMNHQPNIELAVVQKIKAQFVTFQY